MSKCRLLGDFSIFIQFVLFAIALLSLMIKRSRENPVRPLRVWIFDTSKQGISSAILHFSNILYSVSLDNPCILYFLHILLDTTLGVYILSVLIKFTYPIVLKLDSELESGVYPNFRSWMKQLILFLIWWGITKSLIIFIISFRIAQSLGTFLLSPLLSLQDERLTITFVVLLLPLGLNILQAWLIDSLIKYNQNIFIRLDQANEEFEENIN